MTNKNKYFPSEETGGLPIEIHEIEGQKWVSYEDCKLLLDFKNLQISHLERRIEDTGLFFSSDDL